MTSRLTALQASFVSDALSLGPHWVYNQAKVARLYPDGVYSYDDPRSNYHPNRKAGQFTHYGDQTLCLLRSLALRRGWQLDGFREDWRNMWGDYDGFLDGATKQTLAHLDEGQTTPSDSQELHLPRLRRPPPHQFHRFAVRSHRHRRLGLPPELSSTGLLHKGEQGRSSPGGTNDQPRMNTNERQDLEHRQFGKGNKHWLRSQGATDVPASVSDSCVLASIRGYFSLL